MRSESTRSSNDFKLCSEPLTEHLRPPTAADLRYETPELDDDVDMFQKLWAEEEWQRKQQERDDKLTRAGKHREQYATDKQVEEFTKAHPDYRES